MIRVVDTRWVIDKAVYHWHQKEALENEKNPDYSEVISLIETTFKIKSATHFKGICIEEIVQKQSQH